jgi:hypothetical protein
MSCCQHCITCWQYDECSCYKWERRGMKFKNNILDNIYFEVVDDDDNERTRDEY